MIVAHDAACPSCAHEHHATRQPKAPSLKQLLLLVIVSIGFAVMGGISRSLFQQFPWASTVSFLFFLAAYLLGGSRTLIRGYRSLRTKHLMDEHVLMSVATLGAMILGEYPEAIAVVVLARIGNYLEDLALERSRKKIQSLFNSTPQKAQVMKDGQWTLENADSVPIGSLIRVAPFETVSLDGIVIEGASTTDTSSLTGESVPRAVQVGDQVYAGSINQKGMLTIRTQKTYDQTQLSKILKSVEEGLDRKSRTETLLTRFARIYTPIVLLMALGVALVPPILVGQPWQPWIYRALYLLVISCPCALVISIPLSYFTGIGRASQKGLFFRGSQNIDNLSKVKSVVWDKTGTLTHGDLAVHKVVGANGMGSEEILDLARRVSEPSGHPLAKSLQNTNQEPLPMMQYTQYEEHPGKGIRAQWAGHRVLFGSAHWMEENGIPVSPNNDHTQVHISLNGAYIGRIEFKDRPKPMLHKVLSNLRKIGVEHIAMLSGDAKATVKDFASELDLDEVHGGLLPDQKLSQLESMMGGRQGKEKTVFVGDGFNDTPCLARADVGFAMGRIGTQWALETADVVIMDDSPHKIEEAIQLSKSTVRTVYQNLIIIMGAKSVFVLLGVMGLASMWAAVFADVGISLIAILNAIRKPL